MDKNKDGYFRESFTFEGKRYNVRAKTQRDLWRNVEEKKRRLESGIDITNENTICEKWFYDYLETYRCPKVQSKTYIYLKAMVKNYIAPAIGNKRLKDVKPAELQRILNSGAGMSNSFVSKLRNLIRSAFRQARIDRVIIYDPSEALVMPETTSGTHRAITAEEREHILKVCKTHRAGPWVMFMLYTGARPAETRKARWEDIDFKHKRIILHSAKTDFGDRPVPLTPALLPFLRGGEGYIFTQETTGRPHSTASMQRMWASFKRALDIDMGAQMYRHSIIPQTSKVAIDLTPYCFRHTYATDLQSAGVPINVAKDLLGHKSISMTAKVYTHLSDEAFNAAAEKVCTFEKARQEKKVVVL